MAGEPQPQHEGGKSPVGRTLRRRNPPSPTEQARRKAWAEFWGKPGQEYKRKRLEREGKR